VAVDGIGIAYVTTGFLLVWSGLKNVTIKDELTSFLKGQLPTPNPTGSITVGVGQVNPSTAPTNQTTAVDTSIGAASGGTTVTGAVTTIQNYGLAQMIAGTYGWAGGAQFAALTQVINRESGGNPNAMNSSSGAYGIAQALGHGTPATQGSVTNQYGGYGVPNGTAVGANSGNAADQLIWMMAYIQQTYGTPEGAWNSEETRGYY